MSPMSAPPPADGGMTCGAELYSALVFCGKPNRKGNEVAIEQFQNRRGLSPFCAAFGEKWGLSPSPRGFETASKLLTDFDPAMVQLTRYQTLAKVRA
jgi:hypothetical protein